MMKSIYKGATLNGEHTLRDWKTAIINSDVIGMPEANTLLLDVPGRNGKLDLSEVLTGDVSYNSREIKLQLAKDTNSHNWYDTCIHIFNQIHGKKVDITFDEDKNHYYTGRAAVSSPERFRNGGQMLITIIADPFRYEKDETIISFNGENQICSGIIENSRMPVCPSISVPCDCELVFKNITYQLLAGTQKVNSFILTEGTNNFKIIGSNTVTFTFRKGCL